MAEKLDKGVVLYFSPASIGRRAGARCGACWKFVRGGSCLEVQGDIEEAKVCGLYIHGMPRTNETAIFGINKISKKEAGYGDGDTHCLDCEYIASPREEYSPCARVEGLIQPAGCCNAHERE